MNRLIVSGWSIVELRSVMYKIVRLLSVLLALALLAAACSSDSTDNAADSASGDADTSETTEAAPTTTTTAAPTTTTAPPFPPPEFEPGNCEFNEPVDVTVECGWVEVPEHWDDPTDTDVIRLHVATFTSNETPDDAEPVVYLEGGPGGNTFELVSFSFGEQWGPVLPQHPVVLFTQRGSGGSEVDLECEEVIELGLEQLEEAPDVDDVAEGNEALSECMDRLQGEGADIAAYHTVASANDVDAIRQALGHDQWNIVGVSYGTRLGQEVARNHPEGIRALILDSVQPTDPSLGSLAAVPTTFQGSLNQLFTQCEASAACAAANPDLEDRLRAVVETAGVTPFEVEAADQLTAETHDVVVDDSRLLSAIFQAMYQPEAFAAIPELVTQLEAGDTTTLATLMGLQVTNAPLISNGMYSAVMCHDYLAELTPAAAFIAGATGDPFYDETFAASLEAQFGSMCDVVPTLSAPAAITDPVESAVPTVFMSGAYDPITPPSFADAAAPGFSDRNVVVLPHAGHGAVFSECGMDIALDFFANPDPATADTSCIATSAEPSWVPASLEGVEFEPFEVSLLGIRGVVPAGWIDQGFGSFVRTNTNLAHQTLLIQQGAPGLSSEQLVGLFTAQLGGEAEPDGTIDDSTGRTWEIRNLDSPISMVRFYVAAVDGFSLVVAVFGPADDIADMEANVIPTVLDNIERT